MNRFTERMQRADRRVDRYFAEDPSVVLVIEGQARPVVAIFESPDDMALVQGGGEIQDHAPAISVYTADIVGLEKKCQALIGGASYWVTHIGADEAGRTRVTLARGVPGKDVDPIKWSK
ncbi:hypothetical protein RGP44_002887 [Serratia marcescens]|uniref:head-tail joining protein n=1 Tax=Serratia marcescens TaxID=615 RepID=UPI0005348867|nr:head-tail joining protein [Serratia marcescens]ELN4405946.1 hypothetical protein [Serratia marcescens]HBC0576069.1 hypothetical protein [Serratia marcescens]HBV3812596.1 hypothetical protein [Serratia marcescens]